MKFDLVDAPRILFGPGRIEELGPETARLGDSVLVVTGKRSLRRSGSIDKCLRILRSAGVSPHLFDQVEPEPSFRTVDSGAAEARRRAVDSVIGLGGGSAIDAAKAIAFLANKTGTVGDYYSGPAPKQPGLPFLAVPTTAGTGAEVTQNSVLTDPTVPKKESLRGRVLLADLVILDPELTLNCPPEVTAYTGMDALTQAIESLISINANPVTDALAHGALSLIGPNLKTAVARPNHLPARQSLLLGSTMAGLALTNARLGAVHGLAHPLGSRHGIGHGTVCAVLLPHVVRFNGEDSGPLGEVTRAKYQAAVADIFPGLPLPEIRSSGHYLADRIDVLIKEIGISPRLRDHGSRKEDYPLIARESLPSGSLKANPRPAGEAELTTILEAAY